VSDRTDERVTTIEDEPPIDKRASHVIHALAIAADAFDLLGQQMNRTMAIDTIGLVKSLAADAAETASLREETQTLREQLAAAEARVAEAELDVEQRCIKHASTSVANGDCVICDVEIAEEERDAAVADRDRLAAFRDEVARQVGLYESGWNDEMGLTEREVIPFIAGALDALAGEGSDDA